jgi:glucose-1-phosphate adenylyltransferase
VQEDGCREVLILSGDQLYRMDFRHLIRTHRDSRADVTIAVLPVPEDQTPGLGIVRVKEAGKVIDFVEKPKTAEQRDPFRLPPEALERRGIAGKGREYLASMGIYLFNRQTLFDLLSTEPLATDFGKEIFPRSLLTHRVQAYLFDGYWEDLGTIKAYHEAHLALASDDPPFDFHTSEGVIYTHMRNLPAPRVSAAGLKECLLSDGCVIQPGARIERSVIGVRSHVGRDAVLRETVMLGANYFDAEVRDDRRREGVPTLGIGAGSVLERVILDKNCRIGRGVRIVNSRGVQEAEADNYVIRDGIVVIPGGAVVPDGTVI